MFMVAPNLPVGLCISPGPPLPFLLQVGLGFSRANYISLQTWEQRFCGRASPFSPPAGSLCGELGKCALIGTFASQGP